MNLWQILTIDWPCALGDWLWANLMIPLRAGLARLTFRRIIFLAALMVAIIAFAQIVSIDLAFVWAGDTALYFEIASAVMFFAARARVRPTLHIVAQKVRAAAKDVTALAMRHGGSVRQRRNANALRRKSGDGKKSDDEPAAWGWAASGAFA